MSPPVSPHLVKNLKKGNESNFPLSNDKTLLLSVFFVIDKQYMFIMVIMMMSQSVSQSRVLFRTVD